MADMTIGIIIGAAFGKIVTSLVNDVIMPPLALLVGDVDFSDKIIDVPPPTRHLLWCSNTAHS